MIRAALYMRVSSLDQHPETQLYDLRQMASQRGYEIVHKYTDRLSGAKARRPGLDELMRDARAPRAYRRHWHCLQQTHEELRERLQEATADTKPIQRALKEQRGVINDIHSRLLAVSKGLEKRPS